MRELQPLGFPIGPVNNIKQTFDHPQVQARKMVQHVDHPTCGSIPLVGPAVKYSQGGCYIRSPPPILGQHTREILTQLGYSSQEIIAFEAKHIV